MAFTFHPSRDTDYDTGSGIAFYGIVPNITNTTMSIQPITVEIEGQTYTGNDVSSLQPFTPNVSLGEVSSLQAGFHTAIVRPGIIGTPFNISLGYNETSSGSVAWVAGQDPCRSGVHISDVCLLHPLDMQTLWSSFHRVLGILVPFLFFSMDSMGLP